MTSYNHEIFMREPFATPKVYNEYEGGWVGRWCWVASSVWASYYFGRAGVCCACSKCRMGGLCFIIYLYISIYIYIYIYFFFFFFLSRLSYPSFSNASFVGRRLDILKYCCLGRYNPAVVVSYYRRRAR